MANLDIALKGNDLFIANGDLVIAESDTQHVADTINAFPGWWKEHPAEGVGVFQYLNAAGQEQALRRSIIINLQSDGYTVNNPEVSISANGQLNINPNATNDNV